MKDTPGLLYVAATLLPLASFLVLLLVGTLRWAARPYRESGLGQSLYQILGGDRPQRTGAYIATGAIALSFVLSLVGFIQFMGENPLHSAHEAERRLRVRQQILLGNDDCGFDRPSCDGTHPGDVRVEGKAHVEDARNPNNCTR